MDFRMDSGSFPFYGEKNIVKAKNVIYNIIMAYFSQFLFNTFFLPPQLVHQLISQRTKNKAYADPLTPVYRMMIYENTQQHCHHFPRYVDQWKDMLLEVSYYVVNGNLSD